ncbi:CocE/NonD family hydrolase [Solirubrobacter sp. CPCC 204708]|uniref:CocE/NonD family hydrolase n=1 Tax=Solirubrobacter deserti TaxID=2282478 RepID=A0ABT4RHI8_9ACTN|nr:CocE/NonD family hydrolase [Solirubrobacter deserti]MBE2316482.1 CocE/NonD family hydrolase [Solirubrobacter deserti]MDA0138015.1 CocE/NonD family hydrolase [Solirubrobacter deserti]
MRGLIAGVLALAMLAVGTGAAQAQGPVLENGKTKAVYDYTKAVKERVFIPQPGIDQDRNGADDWVTVDIIRPAEASATNKMPAIIDPSPYYTTLCRGAESQCMADWDGDGVNDRWPLFYDNYFVPRGYAYVLGQMNGTGMSVHGCPMHGGTGDIAGEKSIVDWLNGRVKAYKSTSLTSEEVTAAWHNGASSMIGKSYDGTLANGVAATGVEGLKTIVPISAISQWYTYSRNGGTVQSTNYPGAYLNNLVTFPGTAPTGHAGAVYNLPNRRAVCTPINQAEIDDDNQIDTGDGDRHGDINTFWDQRDYVKNAGKVKASVLIAHGFQDDNVRMDQVDVWWRALRANNVPTKLWLLRAGHEDPFESRRAEWVDTLHRWFDHWLYGVQNGIMSEKPVTVEEEKDVWKDYGSWPIDGTQDVDLYLRATDNPAAAGTLGGLAGGGAADSLTYLARNNSSENTLMNSPTGAQTNRRVFLSRPLTKDVRLSGTPLADVAAALDKTQGNVSVTIVDYGVLNANGTRQNFTQTSRSSEGVDLVAARSCWGVSSDGVTCQNANVGDPCTAPAREVEHACYQNISKPTTNVAQWRVSRGILDSSNRDTLWFANASAVKIGETNRFKFPTIPTEHIFKAGHQIGIVIGGSNTSFMGAAGGNDNVNVTLDTRTSKVTLPIQGGYAAAASAGLTDAETVAPTLGDVPADVLVGTTDASGAAVTYTLPTATDNEDPSPLVTCDPASGSKFQVGTTTVTCVAKDANGNASAPKTFKVVVRHDVPVDVPVGGSVPATLALTLGAAARFDPFVPGVEQDYTAETTATVVSTAGNAALSVSAPGHLANGAFTLAEPLRVEFSKAAWTAPVSNETVDVRFKQLIKRTDPLRTGTYAKTLTFTLSTTAP